MGMQLMPFEFEKKPIRVVTHEDGTWSVVAKDIAEALEYVWKGASGTISHIPEEWRGVCSVQTPSGVQEMVTVSEQGLYFFVGRSDKPKSLPFQKWVYGDVLPAIRKTGSYSIPTLTPAELILRQAEMLVALEQEQKRQGEELKALAERQRITDGKIEDFASGAEHYSITAYNKLFRDTQISNSEANKEGRQLTAIAKNNGFELGRAPHPVWGTINTYPKAMLDAFYRHEYH